MVGVRECLENQDEVGDHEVDNQERRRVLRWANQVCDRQRRGERRDDQAESRDGSGDRIAKMKMAEEWRMAARRGSGLLELGGELGRRWVLRGRRDGFGLLGLGVGQELRRLRPRLERVRDFCQRQLEEGRERWRVLPWNWYGCEGEPLVPRRS